MVPANTNGEGSAIPGCSMSGLEGPCCQCLRWECDKANGSEQSDNQEEEPCTLEDEAGALDGV